VQHLGCRDRLLGWNGAQRACWLDHVANNVRFLVLPWVKVPNVASVILSESLCLLQRDWFQRYGVPAWLVESFVDRQRFSGASYRAANCRPSAGRAVLRSDKESSSIMVNPRRCMSM